MSRSLSVIVFLLSLLFGLNFGVNDTIITNGDPELGDDSFLIKFWEIVRNFHSSLIFFRVV
jgi:hypothetical protein